MLIAAAAAAANGLPIFDGGSSNAELCSWKEAPFPKHLNNNPDTKLKHLRDEAEKKAIVK